MIVRTIVRTIVRDSYNVARDSCNFREGSGDQGPDDQKKTDKKVGDQGDYVEEDFGLKKRKSGHKGLIRKSRFWPNRWKKKHEGFADRSIRA